MALRKAQAARGCRRKAAVAAIAGVLRGLKSCWREEGGGGHTVFYSGELSRFRGVCCQAALSASFFADDDNIFSSPR